MYIILYTQLYLRIGIFTNNKAFINSGTVTMLTALTTQWIYSVKTTIMAHITNYRHEGQ